MDNKLDCQFLTMQASVDTNKKDTDELKKKIKKHDSKFTNIKSNFTETKTIIKQIMVQNQHYLPDKME